MNHPLACEDRLDAHVFLWRPFRPPAVLWEVFIYCIQKHQKVQHRISGPPPLIRC